MGLRKWFVAVGLALCVAAGASAEEIVLKLALQSDDPGGAWDAILKPWTDGIVAQSGGRIRFETLTVSAGEQVAALHTNLREGVFDVVWAPLGLGAKRFKRTEVFELPFMMSNPEATSKALWEYVETYAVDEFKDVRLLGLHVKGPIVFHTAGAAIVSPASLKGMRLQSTHRTAGEFLTQFGAEIVGADADRDIVGRVGDWASAARSGRKSRFRLHTQFGPTASLATSTYMLAINPKTYEAMPDDLRRIIDANAGIETSAGFGRRAQQVSALARDRLAGRDGFASIRTLPVAETQAFRKASLKVEQAWVAEVSDKGFDGLTLLDGARTLIRKYTR